MIYLDNAATTRVRDEAAELMLGFMKEEFGNPSALYSLGRRAHSAIEEARKRIARGIGAKLPREVFFTSGGTESDNWALSGAVQLGKGKHIITSKTEHHAILYTCEALEKRGCRVTYLDVDRFGMVDPLDVEAAICDDTAIISIMYANNEVGTINPIAEIGEIAHRHGILFHTDAVQAAGHLPIDVEAQSIDLLSISAHKFYAPKGVGALYIRNGINLPKILFGGAQERNLRPGTENTASIAGMGLAFELAAAELEEKSRTIASLRDLFIDEIMRRIPLVRLNGHPEKRLPGNVNLMFEFAGSDALLLSLDMEGIACSGGSACSAGAAEASHVLLAMGLTPEEARSSVRFSIGKYNTKEEILHTVDVLERLVRRMREISPLYAEKHSAKD